MFGGSALFDRHKAKKKGLKSLNDYNKAYRDFFGAKVLLNSSNPDTFFVTDTNDASVCMVTIHHKVKTDEDELR